MAQAYHVAGECLVKTGTGSSSALEVVGLTVEGVDITINEYKHPIHSDAGGGTAGGPVEFQNMGADAVVRCRFVSWDQSVLDKVVKKHSGDATSPAPGMMGSAGRLVGANDSYRLVVQPPSGSAENPFDFPVATTRSAQKVRMGSQYSEYEIEFYCWRYLSGAAVTSKDVKLFDRDSTS